MPPLVPQLREDLAYVYCFACRDAGTPNVPLRRNTNLNLPPFVCSINPMHQFTFAQLQQHSAEMTPMAAVMQEQINAASVKWAIWVMPNTKALLEQKWSGRIYTSVATLLDALADDSVIFIQGVEVKELRKRGIQNGEQILAALNNAKETERQLQEAVEMIKQFRDALSSVEGGG